VFGALGDRVGRRKVLLWGYALTLLTLFPLFKGLSYASNPPLMAALKSSPVTVYGSDCSFAVFAKVQTTPCAKVLDFLTRRGVAYQKQNDASISVRVQVGTQAIDGFDEAGLRAALATAGYPDQGGTIKRHLWAIALIAFSLMFLSAITYGGVAAILVEMFPARLRYTSMSIPYHIGTGYFGGFLPFVNQYIAVKSGDPLAGLWYTFAVVAVAFVVCLWGLPDTRGRSISD
jgi:nitrate/nitrite transporter NarK